jgi:hypothetical protein
MFLIAGELMRTSQRSAYFSPLPNGNFVPADQHNVLAGRLASLRFIFGEKHPAH